MLDIFLFSANAILPILLVMLIGYWLHHVKIVNDDFIARANRLCFTVTLPIQEFANIYNPEDIQLPSGRLIAFAVISVIVTVTVLWVVIPLIEKDQRKAGSMIQAIYRGNFLLFGIPLATNLFGEEGMLPTALLLPIAVPLYNVLAVIVLSRFGGENKPKPKHVIKTILTNPLIVAAVLALGVSFLKVQLPAFLTKTASSIGASATPLALMMLGAQFDVAKFKTTIRQTLFSSAMRLVIVPAIVMTIAVLLGFRGPELGAILILFCAPTAVSSFIMARSMGCDGDLAGQLVVSTTFFCGFTLFLEVALLKGLSFI